MVACATCPPTLGRTIRPFFRCETCRRSHDRRLIDRCTTHDVRRRRRFVQADHGLLAINSYIVAIVAELLGRDALVGRRCESCKEHRHERRGHGIDQLHGNSFPVDSLQCHYPQNLRMRQLDTNKLGLQNNNALFFRALLFTLVAPVLIYAREI